MQSYLDAHTTVSADPILQENPNRFTAFPIQYQSLFDHYNKQVACFWTQGEIDFSRDPADWKKLTPDEQHFIKMVLAFFAASDGIVMENLMERFTSDVKVFEATANYAFQNAMEVVHSIVYSLQIESIISDKQEKDKLFHAIQHYPCVKKKADWAFKWLGSNQPFHVRLVAFAVVEGIFFSGSFCSIYWIKQRGLMPGLCQSNELISRDEGLHTDLACILHGLLQTKTPTEQIHQIIKEGVAIEKEFITEAIPVKLIGMNCDTMSRYIEFVADRLCKSLDVPPIYNAENPFLFMELISIPQKTSFFERRVSEYQRSGVLTTTEENKFSMDEDF